jgi:hypothetical protein
MSSYFRLRYNRSMKAFVTATGLIADNIVIHGDAT